MELGGCFKTREKNKVANSTTAHVEMSSAAMAVAFERHTLHRKILLKKLQHAQKATKQSLQQINKWKEENPTGARPEDTLAIEEYDELWEMAIEIFENANIPATDLKRIEDILLTIPKLIKEYYDAIVRQDINLQHMIKVYASQKYHNALKIIEKISNDPSLMSAMTDRAFDDDITETDLKAFKFLVHTNQAELY